MVCVCPSSQSVFNNIFAGVGGGSRLLQYLEFFFSLDSFVATWLVPFCVFFQSNIAVFPIVSIFSRIWSPPSFSTILFFLLQFALCFCWSSRFLGFVVPVPCGLLYSCAISLFLIEVVMTQEQRCNNSIFIQYSHCVSFTIASLLSWCVWSPFLWCACPSSQSSIVIRRWWWWLFPLASVPCISIPLHRSLPLGCVFVCAFFQSNISVVPIVSIFFRGFGARLPSVPFCFLLLQSVALCFCWSSRFLGFVVPVPCGLLYLCAISPSVCFLSRSS